MNFDNIELANVQNEIPEELVHDMFMSGLTELQAAIRKKFRSKIPSPKFPDFNYIYFKPFKSLMVPHMVPDYIPMLHKFLSEYPSIWNMVIKDTDLCGGEVIKVGEMDSDFNVNDLLGFLHICADLNIHLDIPESGTYRYGREKYTKRIFIKQFNQKRNTYFRDIEHKREWLAALKSIEQRTGIDIILNMSLCNNCICI